MALSFVRNTERDLETDLKLCQDRVNYWADSPNHKE